MDIIWHNESIGEDFKRFWIFYEFLKIWSNYGWPKFAISAWTFRKLQMVFCGHINCGVASPHDVPFLFVKGILVDASQMEA